MESIIRTRVSKENMPGLREALAGQSRPVLFRQILSLHVTVGIVKQEGALSEDRPNITQVIFGRKLIYITNDFSRSKLGVMVTEITSDQRINLTRGNWEVVSAVDLSYLAPLIP